MTEPLKNINFDPQFPETTKEEIDKAILEFKEKFDKELSQADALRYANLKNELVYWLTLEKKCEEKDCITEDMAKETKKLFKKNYGQDITLEWAFLEAKKSLIITIADVRTRIDNEIREMIKKYE
ncbi:hypothetical protein COY62_02195 [bacterium (Candidatus Howlettbacteria) CG_4_10_14_0_8_um_filter_40_9]|nr:MAG: hypothetical protein COY62_02195 [bacterium (Candidatus Howlettbacteria) CG_4_10_14_0_8_um_filter_40_9]